MPAMPSGGSVIDRAERAIPAVPSGMPATGVLLVGTSETVRELVAQLQCLARPPVVAGCVLVGSVTGEAPVPVVGGLDDLPVLTARLGLRLALVSLPPVMGEAGVRVSAALRTAGLGERRVPTIAELFGVGIDTGGADELSGSDTPGAAPSLWEGGRMPAIDLAALIGRRPHDLDEEAVGAVLSGKRVLITGAGGSIGAELARVAARFGPSQIILMERGENALFEIDRQIGRKFPGVSRKAILHDVADAEGTLKLLEQLRPHAVFHAAAHKHVPLMEDHPAHAVTNNVFGTKSIADAAVACGAERFVMISSDKAVNPTSVMGATKRLAELYVQSLGQRPGCRTRLSMVRFGNVLGSSASVLTIWSAQIAEGGPITITDPRMTRYFMTIPEAATLVIHSTTLGPGPRNGGDLASGSGGGTAGVFVLDMGQELRILDVACRFVRAHGLWARVRYESAGLPVVGGAHPPAGMPAIDVVFSGVRPGEKLHEELAYDAEELRPTEHPGIRVWSGEERGGSKRVPEMVAELSAARHSGDRETVLAAIRKHVPEMRPADGGPSQGARGVERPAA